MKVGLLTREYPPEVYGGAGVHVEYLARELAHHVDLRVHCFGAPRADPLVAATYTPWEGIAGSSPSDAALAAMSVDLAMARGVQGVDLVHSHTWYANLGGHLAQLLWGIPHVMTAHSLEPLRPWKAEQLGGGYALSSYCERTAVEAASAVVAVSDGMRGDVLACYPAVDPARVHVIPNGIDAEEYRPGMGTDAVRALGLDPERPVVLFLGRVTRQKGIVHLLAALPRIDPRAQVVLLAGAADTPELGDEVRRLHEDAVSTRGSVLWVDGMLPRADVIQLLGAATVMVCPSVYEPFGLVNVEAMACGTAVVASAVGGIPEIVVEGVTGYLVPVQTGDGPGGTVDAEAAGTFQLGLAARINQLVADPELAARLGAAGRRRAVESFSWSAVGARTAALYAALVAEHTAAHAGA